MLSIPRNCHRARLETSKHRNPGHASRPRLYAERSVLFRDPTERQHWNPDRPRNASQLLQPSRRKIRRLRDRFKHGTEHNIIRSLSFSDEDFFGGVTRKPNHESWGSNRPPLRRRDGFSRQMHASRASGHCDVDTGVHQNPPRRRQRPAHQSDQIAGAQVLFANLNPICATARDGVQQVLDRTSATVRDVATNHSSPECFFVI